MLRSNGYTVLQWTVYSEIIRNRKPLLFNIKYEPYARNGILMHKNNKNSGFAGAPGDNIERGGGYGSLYFFVQCNLYKIRFFKAL